MSEQFEPEVRRDRREHGGAPDRLDDDALARRTEQERVDAGIDAFDPDDVPPATDEAPAYDASRGRGEPGGGGRGEPRRNPRASCTPSPRITRTHQRDTTVRDGLLARPGEIPGITP